LIDGISAQLDYLALYAGADGYPKINTSDPRHFGYLFGTAKNVEALGGKWAGSMTYGSDIVRMMNEIEHTVVDVDIPPVIDIPVVELTPVLKIMYQGKLVDLNEVPSFTANWDNVNKSLTITTQ
jgi:hypothetical protein